MSGRGTTNTGGAGGTRPGGSSTHGAGQGHGTVGPGRIDRALLTIRAAAYAVLLSAGLIAALADPWRGAW